MTSFLKTSAVALTFSLLAPLTAHATQWTFDGADSSLTLQGTDAGRPFEGEFRTFSADIVLNPEDLSNASISAEIDTGSVFTADDKRDSALPGRDWFDVLNFPTATFVSESITSDGDSNYKAEGTLTIKGISHPLTLPFTLAIEGNNATAKGTVSLNRQIFKVGTGDFDTESIAGYTVEISYTISATK